MKTPKILITIPVIFAVVQILVGQEISLFGSTSHDPVAGVVDKKSQDNSVIPVLPDRVASLSALQAKLEGGAKIYDNNRIAGLNGFNGTASASWQINVQESGSYVIKARVSTEANPQDINCIFSIGNISERLRPVKTWGWDYFAEIQIMETNLPKGQQTVKLVASQKFHGADIYDIRIIPKNQTGIEIYHDRTTTILPSDASFTNSTYEANNQCIASIQDIESISDNSVIEWKVQVKHTGKYLVEADIASQKTQISQESPFICSIGQSSALWRGIYTGGWDKFRRIPLCTLEVPAGIHDLKITSNCNGAVNIGKLYITPANGTSQSVPPSPSPSAGIAGDDIEKKKEALRKRSRFGMTEAELTLLWGNPYVPNQPWAYIYGQSNERCPGIKNEHQKYFPNTLEDIKVFEISNNKMQVRFHNGRAVAMKFYRKTGTSPDMTYIDCLKLAEALCGASFPNPRYKDEKYHTLYSNDMGQSYMVQLDDRDVYIFHMPACIQMWETQIAAKIRKEKATAVNKLIDSI